METHKINFPFIELRRGRSETTGKEIIDWGPMFMFRNNFGDELLHKRFIELYKKKKK